MKFRADLFCYEGNVSYLEAATKTAVFYATTVQRRDGTIYYDSNVDGSAIENDLCGSAVGFLLQLSLRLLRLHPSPLPPTADLLRATVTRSVSWLLANQYPTGHPDKNLAGAFLELDFRHKAYCKFTCDFYVVLFGQIACIF